MKNIHIIPTDKPSRLFKCRFKGHFILDPFTDLEGCFEEGFDPQNIYITSDEEIKEGVDQWYLDKVLNEPYNSGGAQYSSNQDVIILTTDQDLIKDGIQAVDDEFLEWFVKNLSCEEVEVDYGFFTASGRKVDPMDILQNHSQCDWKYKIIIPKEEPKQENDYTALLKPVGTRQETLEEVLGSSMCQFSVVENKLAKLYRNQVKIYEAITKKQERSYSEEDMIKAICMKKDGVSVDSIIEKFKKK
jgi:hypothetical protein